ncbi:restriction endonuclease subunit S [Photobacterium sp. GB-36]|uniref:restriction endonuclease subunit S n=1 Tax=Photobacterium sp. GB-36 TaxID=2022108 RepID=UPI000D163741|nr:restriction endonuclease subunit S [Photobacterium sp. GB-36]PSV47850.1 type I restriction endonuclease subunit S [Photobacterium sp. GB-36]
MSWPTVKLKELITLTGGFAFKSGDFQENGVPLIRIGNANSGTFKTSGMVFLPRDYELKYSKFLVKPKDLLITLTGTVGKGDYGNVCEATADHDSYLLNQRVAKFNIESADLFKRYLYLFLSTPQIKKQLTSLSRGVRQANIKNDDILELQIPLPPLEEQKRIAAILDKADAIRHKRKQAIELADEFLRSVFLDMFGDPVTNPKGFPVKVLSELYIDPKNGTKCGPFGSALKKEEFVDKGIPVWNMDNISLSGNFKDEPKLWVTEEKFNEINAYSVIDGDVIISRAGTVGKMGVVRSKYSSSLISTNLIRVRFSDDLLPEYFVSLMTYCKGRVGRLKTGPDGSFTHMNTGILDKLELPYPPVELQRKFLKLLADTEKNLDKMSPRQLSLLFNALSQKAFSGQL